MLVTSWRKGVCVYVLIYVTAKLLFYFLKRSSSGYDHLHILRFSQIIDMNLVMFPGTVFLWARLKSFVVPEYDDKKQTVDSESNIRSRSFIFQLSYSIFAGLVHASSFTYYFYKAPGVSYFAFGSLLLFGVWINLVFVLLAFSILNFVVRLLQATKIGRELLKPLLKIYFVKAILTDARFQVLSTLILTAALSVTHVYGAHSLQVKRVHIGLDNLPNEFQNLKIALLSDIHLGPTIAESHIWKIVNVTNTLEPDLVIIDGDLVDGSVEDLGQSAVPLQFLKSRFGTFYSTGNHEYYFGKVDDWFAYMEQLNVKVLHNDNYKIRLADNGPYLCLGGVDDIYANYINLDGHKLDAVKAFNSCDTDAIKVLIAHNPSGANLAIEQDGSIDLVLSGHVHAGQMFVYAPVMYVTMPYFYGLYWHSNGKTQIYVTAGCHYWAAPMKMPGMSQVTLVTLNTRSSN